MDNNLYYYPNKDDDIFYINDTSTAYNLAEWQNLGFGANSFVTDPLFTVSNPQSSDDFMITESSAARNGGRTVPVYTDYNEKRRPQEGAFDIGAFEYGKNFYWPLFLPTKERTP